MGFRHLGDLRPDQLEGFTPFMQGGFTPERFEVDPTHVQKILMRFRDMEVKTGPRPSGRGIRKIDLTGQTSFLALRGIRCSAG
jgi:hypothetical protein